MADVTDATFERDVIERSKTVPVIVDLWAPWCGPCTTLGPMLEAAVASTDGRVELAKVNVDENPGISRAFGVQSIPAVFAFVDGKGVDGFIGAQSEAKVAAFVAKLVPEVSEVDLLLAAGDEASLRKALELAPGHPGASYALAKVLLEDRRAAEVPELLLALVPDPQAEQLLAEAAAVLADLDQAFHQVLPQLDELLGSVKADEAARSTYLQLLETLPSTDPRTVAARKALSARLF